MDLVKITGAAMIAAVLGSCGGDGGSSSSQIPPASGGAGSGNISTVTLSGQVTFDFVPHGEISYGLNYDAISQEPARGIVVVLLDENNGTLDQTITDSSGQYSFQVNAGKDVKVQARAHLDQPGRFDVRVTDNTLDNALYVMEGTLNSSGNSARQIRNLHAKSGWNGFRYNANRVAGPFAILDPVYDAIQMVQETDPDVHLPDMEFRWSPNNKAITGDKSQGLIGTSGFYKDENAVYLLGDADQDTDEYDPHVIIHEWGHYFEHNLARMDSMGGRHGLNEKLDPRLAFSEGFGSGLSAIMTGDPEYKDSSGSGQGSGFAIDFENLQTSRSGWFNEGSVAAILYDIYDENSDVDDRISGGFAPIYKAMTHAGVRDADIFSTIFTFSDALLAGNDINASDYRLLLGSQNISASNAQGTGERNDGAISSSLPIYKTASIDNEPVTVCSVNDAGRFNKLGNRELVFFDIPTAGRFEIKLEHASSSGSHDPEIKIWQDGQLKIESQSTQVNLESYTGELSAGSYVAELYDYYNISGDPARSGDVCFNFVIQTR